MPLTERDQIVEAFATNRANESLAERIGLWALRRSLQYPNTKASQREIHVRSEDGVPIMDQASIRMIERKKLTKLLRGPFGGWMLGHIEMQDSARADLHCDEHIQYSEIHSYRSQEISGYDCLGVIANECAPSLAGCSARTILPQILLDGSGRNLDAELQTQLVGDPFFA